MTYRVLENTLVQLPLGRSALPQLVVVIVEALPVGTELLQAGLVDIVDAVRVPVVSIHAVVPSQVVESRVDRPMASNNSDNLRDPAR